MSSLKEFSAKLRDMPRTVAIKVAAAAAPALTEAMQATFNAGEDAYGVGWAPGSEGQKITLKKSGNLAKYVHFVSVGTKLRVALGVKYAKYQVGKRPITPRQGEPLPKAYSDALKKATDSVISAELGR